MAGVELDGLVEIGDGLVVVLLGLVGRGAHEIGVGLGRVDLHRFVHLGDGRVEIADGGEGHGADAMRGDQLVLVGRARGDIGGAGIEHLLDRAVAGEAGTGLFRPSLAGETGEQQRAGKGGAGKAYGKRESAWKTSLGNAGICPV